ncbi:MAG: bifunctional homocysteine S-methyltransferase/methylenetetrahydrofolate reductase [Chloroflexi bacterium]|nr:bifunctional homocysteine S-methyltransferase/methylenetetrahydrofolate reductase [Chloroflexota bacterium]
MSDRLLDLVRERPLLADGAMGTMLHAHGAPFDRCFDELNLTDPAAVAAIHRAYIEAGAGLIETNTFGANHYKLAAHGLESRVGEINAAAVALARKVVAASFRPVLIGGSVGPLGVRLAPFGRVRPEQAFAAFKEQIAALAGAGVDALFIETQSDLHEVREAVRAARAVSPGVPVVATLTFTRDDRTLLGDSPARAAAELAATGADLIGVNCSGGPAQALRVLAAMKGAAPQMRFAVMPNAGWPEHVGGRIMYAATPEYFAEYARAFVEAGASIVGGWCGTTPAHIAAMRAALDSPLPPEAAGRQVISLTEKLGAGKFVIGGEMDPPRGFSTHKLLAGAHLLAEAGADVINVADSPMARMRMSAWAVCHLIQREVKIETVLHFPTRGRNLLRVQGDLLAAHALGVRNLFVVMGDPTAVGDYPEAMDNYDVVPSGLIRLVKHNFNVGVDLGGSDIGGATSFLAGCALNLSPSEPEREGRALRKKLAAGADFALTQPVYDPESALAFVRRHEAAHGPLRLPLLVGVLPLFSARHAAYLHNEVPGISIPPEMQGRIEAAGAGAPAEGVRMAVETIRVLRQWVQGVYLMPPFGRYDLAAEIIEALRDLK